ncbi:hypothetical protein PF005_g19870 [Phytophthora fragariae]|uniref:Secreted protein n=1 Tax=Phytophthora fragariae TaxID=53985 RepID=A0A6A3EBL3_9STRA|nr:hypothetical protein PF003_g23665 [Phytophthora fragariae]KAE8929241.1 hypothetical protein PF009_g20646 [Phytophthora fragariae]KAE9009280.1 hypothetical protein PF011_g10348 [Phytophthora fragariae]KAE9088405.1 hypothetical protein PF007_g19981 [Phytophthora fragariae]KAE9088510.1 hypothetical protein PF010_g19357 [Phytophthora fragariae]
MWPCTVAISSLACYYVWCPHCVTARPAPSYRTVSGGYNYCRLKIQYTNAILIHTRHQ